MPTAALNIYTAQKIEPALRPDLAVLRDAKLTASINYVRGTILGEITATGVLKRYTSGAVDGSQIPTAILPYDVQTDASGNIIYSDTAAQAADQFGQVYLTVPVYIAGWFNLADLIANGGVGAIDAAALALAGAQIILKSGTLASNVGLIRLL